MGFRVSLLAVVLVAVAALAWSGCTPESCYEETKSGVKGGFYETGSGLNIAADSLTVYGVGMETDLIYQNVKDRKDLVLSLDPALQSCSFVVIINSVADTVTFNYTSFPHLVSKECGYAFFHTITSHSSTNNLIDTVLLRNPNIKIPYEENIRIFF